MKMTVIEFDAHLEHPEIGKAAMRVALCIRSMALWGFFPSRIKGFGQKWTLAHEPL
jgi:hypothetical protein